MKFKPFYGIILVGHCIKRIFGSDLSYVEFKSPYLEKVN